MYYLQPTIPIIQIQMANDNMKVAWAPADKKAKPPKLSPIQNKNLKTYEAMIQGGMMDKKELPALMKRHRIAPQFYEHLMK